MLSNYERRVLNQLEGELAHQRTRTASTLRACRLPIASLALAALIYLSVTAPLPRLTSSLAIAVLGVTVGWLLVSAYRRHILGPRIRLRLRRARNQRPPQP